jgi:putative intracellular protease/amidase
MVPGTGNHRSHPSRTSRGAGRWRQVRFTNEEEEGVGLASRATWLLETDIQEKVGVQFSHAPIWEPYLVEDRNLITGQNPNSAEVLAERLLKVLA